MYRISSDPRTARSAELIWDGLTRSASDKGFANVTVTDIQRRTGVSRSTFYRIFDTTLDVLQYQCDLLVDDARKGLPALQGGDRRTFLRHFLEHLLTRADLLELLHRTGHLGMLERAHSRHAAEMLAALGIDPAKVSVSYLAPIMSAVLPAVLGAWVARGRQENPDEVYRQLRQSTAVLSTLYA